MPDPDDLHRLAPEVDATAARAAFDRRRGRRPATQKVLLATAAAVVVLAGAVGLASLRDDEEPLVTGPADGGRGEVTFEVLAVIEANEATPMGTLRAATDLSAYEQLWEASGAGSDRPEADLGAQVVVSITIPDDACPPELRSFERTGDVITPVFVEVVDECEQPLIPKTYVVALDRAPVEPGFTLRLPADELYGFEEQRLDVDLTGDAPTAPPPPAAAACSTIERFAQALVDIEIVYDYEPSASPEALAAESDLVVLGLLTGTVSSFGTAGEAIGTADVGRASAEIDYVGYEISVTNVYKGSAAEVSGGLTVFVAHGRQDTAIFADAAAPGIPVIVFASDGEAGPTAFIEGFATGCPDGGPILGFYGSTAGWQDVRTLADLDARLVDATAAAGDPVVWAHEPSPVEGGMGALIEGLVAYDDANGCFMVVQGDLAHPLVWPAGTTAVDGPGVRLPDGTVARIGDSISGGGGYIQNPGFAIPEACLPRSGEVAVLNVNDAVTVTPG